MQDLKFWPASSAIDSSFTQSHCSSSNFLPLTYTTDYTQSYQSSCSADITTKSTKKQRIKKKHASSRVTHKEDPLLDQQNQALNNNKWLENRANQSSYVKLLSRVSTFDAFEFKEMDGINTPGLESQSQQYRDLDCRYQQ